MELGDRFRVSGYLSTEGRVSRERRVTIHPFFILRFVVSCFTRPSSLATPSPYTRHSTLALLICARLTRTLILLGNLRTVNQRSWSSRKGEHVWASNFSN